LASTTEIDAEGLGTLVFCYARTLRSGGALKVLNLSPLHLNLLVLAKLDTVFQAFTDEQDAVDSFFPDRASRQYDILDSFRSKKRGRVGRVPGFPENERRARDGRPVARASLALRCWRTVFDNCE